MVGLQASQGREDECDNLWAKSLPRAAARQANTKSSRGPPAADFENGWERAALPLGSSATLDMICRSTEAGAGMCQYIRKSI